ncbi:hypothetical protein [Micromonospora parathelypteridis]|uniref:Uncharacterized protein n=1 Tax=Micromonospora parathelypteridis TaxID=1839617 RepID=A0A840VKC3_9ACTN|nr:hypothetical protein [Micromonospora parathelypteridis]MBB5476336.1 hypothetical protein [Micromonospora parathelypteridis]GGO14654.1 hypothetical protein GCM10011576_25870 [Micromonospora parathelypteridis]
MVAAVVRHLAGMAAAWLVFVAEAVVGYLGLLAYALASGSGLGGPLAGPMLVLIAAVLGVVLLPLLFLPAVAVGDAAGRDRGTGRVVALSVPVAVVLAVGYAVGGAIATGVSAGYVPLVAAIAALVVLAPVVLYALTVSGLGWVARRVPRRWGGTAIAVPAEAS